MGRVLACLNALKPTFNVLPPHFDLENPLKNDDVGEAMSLMYGPIIDRWENTPMDPTGLLLRLLASVIYHFDWIKMIAHKRIDHPFNAIPLMFCPEIVSSLKNMITIKPSNVIKEATGIPPHVEHSIKMQEILTVANECLSILQNQLSNIKKVSLYLCQS